MTRPDFIRSRLSIAEVDALKEELSASQAERQSLHACIARIWKVLGINTYEGANGKELSELVADALTSSRTEAAALREAATKAKILIGAQNDTATDAVKESNINQAWHILDRAALL